MKKLLIAILMLASVLGVSAQGFKISAYPNKAVPADSDLFLLATPNVANWNITSAQLRQYVTNGMVIPVVTGNATNFWGVLSLTNLPPGVLTNNYTLPVVFSNSVTTGDLTVNGTLTVNSTNNQTLVSNLTVYGWQTNFGLISSTNFVGLFYGDGSGLTNLQGTALDPSVLTNNRTIVTTFSNDTRVVGNFIVLGPITGNGSGITNLPVAGIAATGIGATKFLKGDGTWDIPSGGAATNVVWPVGGTNTILITNGLEVQINVPVAGNYITNGQSGLALGSLLFGGYDSIIFTNTSAVGVSLENVGTQFRFQNTTDPSTLASVVAKFQGPGADITGIIYTNGGTITGPILSTSSTTNAPSQTELATAGWVRGLGMLTNGSTNVTLNGLTVNTYLTINATNATTTVSNLLVTGWQTNYGALSSTNFTGVFYGNGAGLTNAPYLPLAGGTVTGPVLSTSSSTNSPSDTELATAGWIRGLFQNGVLYYSTTNLASGYTNSDYPNIYTFSTSIPLSGARGYTNAALTAGNYLGTVVTTNTFQQVIGPIHIDSYIGFTSSGSPNVSIHPEIYYSYDKTNWYGDFSSGDQAITLGSTNLKQFVVSFPTVTATNANGFYLARRWKVGSSSGLGASSVVWFLQGTNALSGVGAASHIAIDSPSSGGGDAFLANNQVFTGTNTFSTWLAGNGGGLTNLTASVVTGATLTNQVYASNVVSGGILPVGTVATNNPWAGAFLTGVASTRFWTQDGSTLTNITAAQTPWGSDINGNQKNLTNVASIVVAGPGTNWLDMTYITNGTRTFFHDGTHTVITNTASLTSSEWTEGSQKEWYNGTPTITIDKTNGNITANGTFTGNGSGLTNLPAPWVKQILCGGLYNNAISAGDSYSPVMAFGVQGSSAVRGTTISPGTGYLSNLVAWSSVAWPATTNYVFTIQTNSNLSTPVSTGLTCTLQPAGGATYTNSGTAFVNLNPSTAANQQVMVLKITSSATVAAQNFAWSVEWWHQ